MTLTITVSDEVRSLAPGFTHIAVEAHGLVNGPSDDEFGAARRRDPKAHRAALRPGAARGPACGRLA